MSLMLLKDALFEKTESRTQMLMTAIGMLVAATMLSFVAWWLLSIGFAALDTSAEYAQNSSQRNGGFGRGSRNPHLIATMFGLGGGGIVGFVALVLALSGVFHLGRWIISEGVKD